MKTRICPYCNEEKILNLENFYWRKNEKGRTERWRIKCKTCCLEGSMKWHHANYDEIKIRRKPYQVQYSKDNKEKLTRMVNGKKGQFVAAANAVMKMIK